MNLELTHELPLIPIANTQFAVRYSKRKKIIKHVNPKNQTIVDRISARRTKTKENLKTKQEPRKERVMNGGKTSTFLKGFKTSEAI